MIRHKINISFAEAALRTPVHALEVIAPVFEDIGEDLADTTKERFVPSPPARGPAPAPALHRHGAPADARGGFV